MMISLYRPSSRRTLQYRSIVERKGRLFTRLTTYCEGGSAVGEPEEELGAAASTQGDRAACAVVRRALSDGYRVLYAFVLPETTPLTHACLSRLPGVEVAPDSTDVLPLLAPGRRARGGKPTYLLFTVLSSAAK